MFAIMLCLIRTVFCISIVESEKRILRWYDGFVVLYCRNEE